MKVILNQTVPKVGKQGQVVTVANGYARNYLFPRGLAILAEKKQIAALSKRTALLDAKSAETKSEAESIKANLEGQTIKLEGKVGQGGTKLFGAITSQDVADAIKDQLKISVEKKQIALIEPIKRLGRHEVEVDLHRNVDAKIIVHVFDPSAPEEPTAPVAEEAGDVEAAEPEPVEA